MFKLGIALTITTTLSFGAAAHACGEQTDCNIGDRTYRVYQPSTDTDRAIIFFHGVGGRASSQIANDGLRRVAENLGTTLIAAQSIQKEWNVPGAPATYAADDPTELDYFDSLQSDISTRFGVDPLQTIVVGFSSGSMVTWNLACFRGQQALGFVAVAGTFWDPIPTSCPSGPINLIHYHGKSDRTVTMEGRKIKDSQQGDVLAAMELLTGRPIDLNQIDRKTDALECYLASTDPGGHAELCLFEGGHTFNTNYILDAWDIFTSKN